MSLRDVWKDLNNSGAGYYTYDDMRNIPNLPGIYAWYYPLDIRQDTLEDFIATLKLIFEYDSGSGKTPVTRDNKFTFPWSVIESSIKVSLKKLDPNRQLGGTPIQTLWNNMYDNAEKVLIFREALLKSSILLPPLYIGKTRSLSERYSEHLRGAEAGCFKSRFTEHMKINNIRIELKDLIFYAIPLNDSILGTEDLLEEILKMLSGPIYSVN